ncbi:MAG: terpene cyclase/mutase family protein [Kiritimatiellae bacterium]|nr:terpene cyclase/mutase family protein [Kiritimatiellia bacterium]
MTMHHDNLPPLQDPAFKELMELFEEKSYWQRLRLMFTGLTKPKDTGAYKAARTELQRQLAPLAAFAIPAACVLLLAVLGSRNANRDRSFETDIMDAEEIKDLEDIIEPDKQLPDDIQPTDIQFTPDIAMDTPAPAENAPMTPQVANFDAVLQVKSPVILRNIYGATRSTGMKGRLMAEGGGNAATETAVIRALRWLKKKQQPDGSWPANKNAMTALAVLCFLAHGEKPGDSVEFGDTVQRGIQFLLGSQPASGQWPGNYEHAIATYAMCEAYGMTMNPNVKAAAERAVKIVIKGQHETGGWDYGMKQSERDDTSVMGWAAQALKAAHMANFYSDRAALEKACKLAVKGFQKNAGPNGGFGYTEPGAGGLSSVGTLCMQFHGAAKRPEVTKTLDLMDAWKPAWNGMRPDTKMTMKDGKPVQPVIAGVVGGCTQYYYYYATQAKFQAGGSRWDKWNDGMWPEYVRAQFVEKNAIADADGKMQDIGWWENIDTHTDRPVMDTCLAALQLMVYYRYLPTFKSMNVEEEVAATATDAGDIKVDVNL